jgi:hypothetical protein
MKILHFWHPFAVAHGGFSTYRREPRRLGCRRGVRSATDGGMERLGNRRGLVFLINERKHTFAMACTVQVPRDNMP